MDEARRRRIEEFKKRMSKRCIYHVMEGWGSCCGLEPLGNNEFRRTECMGRRGPFCIYPDKYRIKEATDD